jgi:hypothetical protein
MIRTFTLKLFLIEKSLDGTYTEVSYEKKDPVTIRLDRKTDKDQYNKEQFHLRQLEISQCWHGN